MLSFWLCFSFIAIAADHQVAHGRRVSSLDASNAYRVGSGDFDGDGFADLVAVVESWAADDNNPWIAEWASPLQDPGFAMPFASAFRPRWGDAAIAQPITGDFDADGDDDIVIPFSTGGARASLLVMQGGPGGLAADRVAVQQPSLREPGSWTEAWNLYDIDEAGLDLNQDGYSDVLLGYTPCAGRASFLEYPGGGEGPPSDGGTLGRSSSFTLRPEGSVSYVDLADYDGDGVTDIATLADEAYYATVEVFPGPVGEDAEGSGTVTSEGPDQLKSRFLRHGDVNGDGYTDIVAANTMVVAGSATGPTSARTTDLTGFPVTGIVGMAVADVDGDGYADMVTNHEMESSTRSPYGRVYWGGPDTLVAERWTGLPQVADIGLPSTALRVGSGARGFAIFSFDKGVQAEVWPIPTPPDEPPNPPSAVGPELEVRRGGVCCSGTPTAPSAPPLALAIVLARRRRNRPSTP